MGSNALALSVNYKHVTTSWSLNSLHYSRIKDGSSAEENIVLYKDSSFRYAAFGMTWHSLLYSNPQKANVIPKRSEESVCLLLQFR